MLTLTLATGVAPPDLSAGRTVNHWRDGEGRVYARALVSDGQCWIQWPGLGVFQFARPSTVVRVWPEPGADRQQLDGAFSRQLQPVILQALGWQALHASAVDGPLGTLALCGQSGHGKSTLAYALQREGLRQRADDALVLEVTATAVSALALPFAPRLSPPARQQLSAVHAAAADSGRRSPLAAVCVLRQHEGVESVRAVPVSPARAFSLLATHAHCFDPSDRDALRRFSTAYLSVAEAVPVFELAYRPDWHALDATIEAMLEIAPLTGWRRPTAAPALAEARKGPA